MQTKIHIALLHSANQDVQRSACLNLVDIKEIIVAGPHVYTVMELCEGGDLCEFLKTQSGRLTPELHQRLAVNLAVAMEALYSSNIIHRDLKPANIMIVKDDRKPYPRNFTFKGTTEFISCEIKFSLLV